MASLSSVLSCDAVSDILDKKPYHRYHIRMVSLQYVRSCLCVCFVALHPKSTAMVMVGRSVHLTTLFPEQP